MIKPSRISFGGTAGIVTSMALGRCRSAAVSNGEYEFIFSSILCDIHTVAKQEAALRRPGGTIGSLGESQRSIQSTMCSRFQIRAEKREIPGSSQASSSTNERTLGWA